MDDHEWTNIVRDICIEGCCFIDIEYDRRHSKYSYQFEPDTREMKKIKNDEYDPDIRREDIPNFCEKRVGYNCLVNRCPFFVFSKSVSGDEPDGGIEPVYFINPRTGASKGLRPPKSSKKSKK